MALSFRPYFKGGIERLIKKSILLPLEFSDLEQCIDCIKGKYVEKITKDAKRSARILEIIHTDICGPFPVKSVDGYDLFIIFIDDYSRFGYRSIALFSPSKYGINDSAIILMIHHELSLLPVKSVDGYDLFITFTDDYSHFAYIYPIKKRSEALDKFKIFNAKVETQHNLNIKVVRSDGGVEYYGRHTPYGQVPGPFARFL